ncbi:MAG: hypothetical protein Q9Q40_02180 [Acidobacteriota bacterium]|nr:hypothetical protein [Acidobacteriota bacterium]MDQ7088556.1 hypothetical protein [Acidobacteriota bacterium]
MPDGFRGPRDDFYCWKYGVWYSLKDCVFRHAWKTTAVCARCPQGGANLELLPTVPKRPRWARTLCLGAREAAGE